MATFSELKAKDNYSKLFLATIEPALRVTTFTDEGGDLYSFTSDSIVTRLSLDEVEFDLVSGVPSIGEFSYDIATNKVTFYNWQDPTLYIVLVWVRFFFASKPCYIPWDFTGSDAVPWLPLIENVSDVEQALDSEYKSTPLESQGTLTLLNDRTFFQDKLRKYIWDNKTVSVYRWSLDSTAAIPDPEQIYSGTVSNIDYSSDALTFSFTNAVKKLRKTVGLCKYFTVADGVFPIEQRATLKRIPMGRVNFMKLNGLDASSEVHPLAVSVGDSLEITTSSSIATYYDAFKYDLLTGDTLTIDGRNYTVSGFGKVSYGVDTPQEWDFIATSGAENTAADAIANSLYGETFGYCKLNCDNADFSNCEAGDYFVLTQNFSVNYGVGRALIFTATTVIFFLYDVIGYETATSGNMDASSVSFYRPDFTGVNIGTTGHTDGTFTDVTVKDVQPKATRNRKYLISPIDVHEFDSTIDSVSIDDITALVVMTDDVADLFEGDYITVNSLYPAQFIIVSINYSSNTVSVQADSRSYGYAVTDIPVGSSVNRPAIQSIKRTDYIGALKDESLTSYSTDIDSEGNNIIEFNSEIFDIASSDLFIKAQIRDCFFMEDPFFARFTGREGTYKNVEVGDLISFNTFGYNSIVIEKINDFAVLARPLPPYADLAPSYTALTETVVVRKIKHLTESTNVFVDVYGIKDDTGSLVKTPYDAMQFLLTDAQVPFDLQAFQDANTLFPCLLSMTLPFEFGGRTVPSYWDILGALADTSHHAVFIEPDGEVAIRAFMESSDGSQRIAEHDIFESPAIKVNSKAGATQITVTRGVTDLITSKNTEISELNSYAEIEGTVSTEKQVWLYFEADAVTYAKRELMFRAGLKTEVTATIAAKEVPLFMSVASLTHRANPSSFRITDSTSIVGIVTRVTTTAGSLATITLDDMSGYYDATAAIGGDSLPDYSSATNEQAESFAWIEDGTVIS